VTETPDLPFEDLQAIVSALDATDSPAQQVELAVELKTVADEVLHDAVLLARANNVSWQQIGDALGISRQAAFQRFRNPNDPRGNDHMRTKTANALIPRAELVYERLRDGDYDSIAEQMTFTTRRALPEKKVMAVWNDAIRAIGSLESLGESFARPSGRAVVVETPLAFEAGDLVGRIAYNRNDKIIGMLILEADRVADAPF